MARASSRSSTSASTPIYLDSPLTAALPAKTAKLLASKLELTTVRDLLLHLPRRHLGPGSVYTPGAVTKGEEVLVEGVVRSYELRDRRSGQGRKYLAVHVATPGGVIVTANFFNAFQMKKVLARNTIVVLQGEISEGRWTMMWQPDLLVVGQAEEPELDGYTTRAAASSPSEITAEDDPAAPLLRLLDDNDLHTHIDALSDTPPAAGQPIADLTVRRWLDVVGALDPSTGKAVLSTLVTKHSINVGLALLLTRPDVPIYPSVKGLDTWTILASVITILDRLDVSVDPISLAEPWEPEGSDPRDALGLPPLDVALWHAHLGVDPDLRLSSIDRIAFDEALTLQLTLALRRRHDGDMAAAPCLPVTGGLTEHVHAALPFTTTTGQDAVRSEISADLERTTPMHRLLQGEVGSGKTVLALLAMLQVIDNEHQCALLAPTDILARQHYATLMTLLGDRAGREVTVTLLVGSLTASERQSALLGIMSGQTDLVVGTHALIDEGVSFADLGLAIVDEQHRFGVSQRDALRAKAPEGRTAHLLVMTATPIPRTVALTAFGDFAVSTLRELPRGRQPVQSFVVDERRDKWMARVWERVREEVAAGHRVYVVCPRIDEEGGTEDTRASVTVVAERLRTGLFPEVPVGVLHGRQHPDDKDAAVAAFASGATPILVSTTVVEVGVDVPEATLMIVLSADSFGASQLHQLRGRIGRGTDPGQCFFVTAADPTSIAHRRVTSVAETKDGFLVAEADLELRRAGDILGTEQSGAKGSLKVLDAVDDLDVIVAAREAAETILDAVDAGADVAPSLRQWFDDLDSDRYSYLRRS